MKKRYVVKKYIEANSIVEVLRIEKKQKPDDIWVDEDWRKLNDEISKNKMGFKC